MMSSSMATKLVYSLRSAETTQSTVYGRWRRPSLQSTVGRDDPVYSSLRLVETTQSTVYRWAL